MPTRRRGAPGSFGAPLEELVTTFPAEVARTALSSVERTGNRAPRLSREDVGASIRAAFLLLDRIEEREGR
jgi:hypothetical protein